MCDIFVAFVLPLHFAQKIADISTVRKFLGRLVDWLVALGLTAL